MCEEPKFKVSEVMEISRTLNVSLVGDIPSFVSTMRVLKENMDYCMSVCTEDMYCHTHKHIITHTFVYFDSLGAFLDSAYYLGPMKMTLVGCMLYVDDTLPCEL